MISKEIKGNQGYDLSANVQEPVQSSSKLGEHLTVRHIGSVTIARHVTSHVTSHVSSTSFSRAYQGVGWGRRKRIRGKNKTEETENHQQIR